ncbi:MAG: VCBS repeat-containing protein, partial [Bacteroidota bacterium]
GSPPRFRSIAPERSGITFANTVREHYGNFFEFFMYVYNGGGVATGDINNDGLMDLYFTGNETPNKLYLNKGNLTFEDITISAGVVGDPNWDNGVSITDVNADGLMDIYVCRGGWQDSPQQRKNLLFINQGDLTFRDQADAYGLGDTGYSMHATFFDIDNDNDLDVYLINRPDSFALGLSVLEARRYDPPAYSRDKLYINDGGRFVEQGKERGMGENYGYGLSATAADINDDGYIDLYVANDFSVEDYFYINQGDGTFKQQIKQVTNHIPMYSMGSDMADLNSDGLEDLVVMEMRPSDYVRSKVSMPSMNVQAFYDILDNNQHKQYMHNMLFLNQGNSFFSEVGQLAGISKTDWSWSVLTSDLDNDGHRDLFVTNGIKRDFFDGDVQLRLKEYLVSTRGQFANPQELFTVGFPGIINSYRPVKVTNYLFRNKGGLDFEDVSERWGFTKPSFSNGAAVVDLDNDGDLDLVTNNFDDPSFLHENTSSGNNWIILDLQGPSTNSEGLGAKITLFTRSGNQIYQHKQSRGYLSNSDPRVHFGLGSGVAVDSVVVLWTDQKVTKVINPSINKINDIKYDPNALKRVPQSKKPTLLEERTSSLITEQFRHEENDFDEYREQVLLPHMFSKSGPFISVADVNGDGLEDFFIGGAAGQAGRLYVQNGDGRFQPQHGELFRADKAYEDMGSAWVDVDGDQDLDLIVVSGGSEFPEGHQLYRDRIYTNDGHGNLTERTFLPSRSSGSCVVAEDVDRDGDQDLFIGGQVVAHQYLMAPESYLYINESGTFVDQTSSLTQGLRNVGMVQSAIWVDLNNDQQKELVVVGEWMPITVFEWRGEMLTDNSEAYGLSQTEGWWNTIAVEDLDGDGDMDMIAGNLGENYKFHASEESPFEVFAGDFDGSGTNDIFLAKKNETRTVPVRGKECSSMQMPGIEERFPTFTAFAQADITQVIGSEIENAVKKKAYLMSSVVIENEGGVLRVRKLPKEAQYSTLLGVEVLDVNDDGVKDLIIAGNKFDVEVETTAADASPGYVLLGQGNLEFEALPPSESGLMIPYNVKSLKAIKVGTGIHFLVGINDDQLRVIGPSGSL